MKKKNIIFDSHLRFWYKLVYQNLDTYKGTLKDLVSEVRKNLIR